jgi:hypothetical protein
MRKARQEGRKDRRKKESKKAIKKYAETMCCTGLQLHVTASGGVTCDTTVV